MSKIPTAFFVEFPRRIEDLMRPHLPEQRKPFVVEHEVTLGKIDYENFITDLCVDRWFIEEYLHLSHIDGGGVWHCVLVRQKNTSKGVLVMSEGMDYPKWAAVMPGEEASE